MSKYLDTIGLGYFWEKIKGYLMSKNIIPEQSKTFTNVKATSNSDPAAWFYFGKIIPDDYNTPWQIRYRINSTIAGLTNYKNAYYNVELCGMHDTYYNYDIHNACNSNYRPLYNHLLYTCTATGITSGYGHLLGMRLQSSYNPTTAANSRTFVIEILETQNCTFSFFDSMTLFSNISGGNSTNYKTRTSLDGTSNGHKMNGDNNDPNYYVRNYYGLRKTYAPLYRYQLCLTRKDKSVLPINSVNNNVTKTKTLTTEAFDPFGDILYWASTSTYSAGANVGDGWYSQYLGDIRYSFNIGGNDVASTLTGRKPLYLVATPQSDGTAILYSEPLAQDLPTSEDGLIYIYLGQIYPDTNPYRLYLLNNHQIYIYKNGNVIPYVGDAETVDGHTVEKNVPSDAVFTDTTYSAGTGLSLSNTTFNNTGVISVKGNEETSYRNGNVNITAKNVGAIAYNSAMMTTNPFAPSETSATSLYISKIDNALYAANKRYNVSATLNGSTYSGNLGSLFDGNYETAIQIAGESSFVLTFDFSNLSGAKFPSYPYGYIYLSFYYICAPSNITARAYNNFESQTIGWHDLAVTDLSASNTQCVYRIRQPYYGLQTLEITIVGDNTNSYGYTRLSQVEMWLDRPDPSKTPFVSKYSAETLHYNLTAPSFTGDLVGNAGSATILSTSRTMQTDLSKASSVSFNGSANVDLGVKGTLSVENGGTGVTTLNDLKTLVKPSIIITNDGVVYI